MEEDEPKFDRYKLHAEYHEPQFYTEEEARAAGIWAETTVAEAEESRLLFAHSGRGWNKVNGHWIDKNGAPAVLDDGRLFDDAVRELERQTQPSKRSTAKEGEVQLRIDHWDRGTAEGWQKVEGHWIDKNGAPAVLDDGRLFDDAVGELQEQERQSNAPKGHEDYGLNIQY